MDIIYDGDKIIDGSKRKDCRSCLQEHDRELFSKLEELFFEYWENSTFPSIHITYDEWHQIKRERGIE